MRNGFTLIELLAVIVILAIIALIATPIVLNIINDTKESSQLRSAEFYLDAVETSIAQSTLNDKKLENKTYNILEDGNLCIEYKDNECINELEVKVNGEVPSSGSITIENGKLSDVWLEMNNKTMVKDNNKWYSPGLYDVNDNLIASWDELVNKYGIDVEKNYGESYNSSKPSEIIMSNENLRKSTKIIIDRSVIQIGNYVFHNWTNLKEIMLPNTITSIGAASIRNCINLTKIVIPNSVTSIGSYAFSGCTSLEKVIIPNSVTTIGGNAFRSCTSLKGILIPSSVTIMGNNVFSYCANLKKITIPDSVTSLGTGFFSKCTNLEKIVIGNGVTSIGTNAFEENKSLTEIVIPRNVTNIEDYAFNQCWNLKTINYTGTREEWNSITLGENWDDNNTPIDKVINYNYVIN